MPLAAGKLDRQRSIKENAMRLKFLRDFDWMPPAEPLTTVARLEGDECTVTREHGEAALAAGAAQEIEPAKAPAKD